MSEKSIFVAAKARSESHLLITRLQEELGCIVSHAHTIEEIRDSLSKNTKHFLAVTDLSFPGSADGSAIDLILAHGIPVVVIAATYDERIRTLLLKKQVVDYIIKENPESVDQIVDVASRCWKNRNTRILIIDDAKLFRDQYIRILKSQLYRVATAASGMEGLAQLARYPDTKLILLDYEMPEMDGFAFLSEIRKTRPKEDLAIIGLSADSAPDLSARFLKMGANDFLHKEFVMEEFTARIAQNIAMVDLVQQLKQAAMYDGLTGLFNRRYFFEAAKICIQKWNRKKIPGFLAMGDLDHFKKINDTFGHQAGDYVLKRFASLLRAFTGKIEEACPARFGGEEFICIFSVKDGATAKNLLQTFCEKTAGNDFTFEDQPIAVTGSFGLCALGNAPIEDAIRRADLALYEAKSSGRNKVITEPNFSYG